MHDDHPINSKLIAAVEIPYKGSECHRLAARKVIITSDVIILYHMVDDVISNNIKQIQNHALGNEFWKLTTEFGESYSILDEKSFRRIEKFNGDSKLC